jgi:hypothetical protein
MGAAGVYRLSAETGSPIVQVTDDSRAIAVTDTAPAVAVAVTGPGSSSHKYSQYRTAIFVSSGPKFIEGSGIGNCLYAC